MAITITYLCAHNNTGFIKNMFLIFLINLCNKTLKNRKLGSLNAITNKNTAVP